MRKVLQGMVGSSMLATDARTSGYGDSLKQCQKQSKAASTQHSLVKVGKVRHGGIRVASGLDARLGVKL